MTIPVDGRELQPTFAAAPGEVAVPGGPYSGTEGTPIAFDASASTGAGPFRYDWDWGDGTPHGTVGPTTTHSYRDNKTYTVRLFIVDVNGAKSNTAQTTAVVANAAPVLAPLASPAAAPRVGTAVTLRGAFEDPGAADTHSGTFVWGDGKSGAAQIQQTGTTGTASGSHAYAAEGTYEVSLRVADDNGGADTVTLSLAVGPRNRPPQAGVGGPYSGVEGTEVAFDGSASVDPDGDELVYDWDFGDGSAHGITPAPTHTYADNKTYTVRLTVTDPYGARSAAVQTTATIANAAPVIAPIPAPLSLLAPGRALSVQASFTDAGIRDGHTATFDWGDGRTSAGTIVQSGGAGTVTGNHTYAAAGQYTVTLRLADNGGAADTATLALTVGGGLSTGTYTFVGAGDVTGCSWEDDELTARVLDRVVAEDPNATIFVAGDMALDYATAAEYATCYTPTWGRHRARTYVAFGNHEYAVDPHPTWDYFGDHAGPRDVGYYSFDLGDYWHVIVLNDNNNNGGPSRAEGSPQDLWLQQDLAANTRPCTIAIWHVPYVAADGTLSTTRKLFWDRLYAAGADIVINGHLHAYEREAPQTPDRVRDDARGIREFVVGTGGAPTANPTAPTPNTEVVSSSHGVLRLTLGQGAYRWEFLWASGPTFSDSGTGTCH